MNEAQIQILRKEIELITTVEVCGRNIALNFGSEKICSDILERSGTLEGTKLALACVHEFPDLEEGDDWQVALFAIPESLKSDVEEKYRNFDDYPVLLEKWVKIPGFKEKTTIQIILDCKDIRGVGFRWSLALGVVL